MKKLIPILLLALFGYNDPIKPKPPIHDPFDPRPPLGTADRV